MPKINPEYVKAIRANVNQCPYFSLLSMKLLDFDIGRSLLEISLEGKHLQPFGVVHGGVFSSIIDAAAFWALFGEVDESSGMTSVDLKLNYLAPARNGKLIAKGRKIKLGKTLGLGEAEVTDQEGRVLAHGTSTLIIMPDLPLIGDELPQKFLEES
ncbi:MAG: PaaI family thioesterase [Desulfomonile tiedjei]|uniref:PaaI family thioesterase n=1 Tax=Desulfomonile tiedjei TaxID=2358 RepID=A0A9D6V3J9_9BACT|nr:PaaI family thioesterase [Desulfomonile tiedjei]